MGLFVTTSSSLLEDKTSNADWISGKDFKDSIVELDRSDVADMLDGLSGGTERVLDLLLFVSGCLSSACDEGDQKDRISDGCVVV